MQQNFKRKILAQAVTAACLAIAATSSYAVTTSSCPTPSNGSIYVGYGNVDSCDLNGNSLEVDSMTGAATVGTVTNTGETSSPSDHGVSVYAEYMNEGDAYASIGSLTNSGTLTGTVNGISVQSQTATAEAHITTVTNLEGGTINGGIEGGGVAIGAYSAGTTSLGSLINSGTIQGHEGIWVRASDADSVVGVTTITNNQGGLLKGENNGIILDAVDGGQVTVGTITNSGTIEGIDGVWIDAYYGPSSVSVGSIVNNADATITGKQGNGIHIGSDFDTDTRATSIGHIVNEGTITGAVEYGIYVGPQATVTDIANHAGGLISGYGGGIVVDLGGQVTDSIVNGGEIRSTDGNGIALSGASQVGLIDNSGTISGKTGIAVTEGSTILSGINNAAGGQIIGTDGPAIDISDAGNAITINNSGLISGDVLLGDGPVAPLSLVTLPSAPTLNLNGTTSRVTGEVHGGPSSVVNVNGTFTSENLFDVGHFNIAENGVFNLAHSVVVSSPDGLKNDGKLSVAAGTTAAITGNYVQGANGVFETGVVSAANYGKLVVTGNADLSAGGKVAVKVSANDTLTNGAVLPNVLKALGTLTTGALSTTDNSAIWNFTAANNGTNGIDLVAALAEVPASTPEPTPAPAPSKPRVGTAPMIENTRIGMPAIGAARVIDQFLVNGNASGDMQTVLNALGSLPTQQDVASAVAQLVPVLTGGMAQATLGAVQGVSRVVQARMETAHGLSSGDDIKVGHGWIKPFGSWADQDDRRGVSGYKADTYGFVLGADSELSPSVRVGAGFAYANTKVDGNATISGQHSKVDTYQFIVYGSRSLDDRTDLNFQADVGMNKNDARRNISFGGLNRTASADYDSWNAHIGAGIGRILDIGAKTTFTPSVRADYLYVRDKAYTESGADALNLKVAGKTTDELIFSVDGKVNYALTSATNLMANLGAGYDALAERSSITTSFVGGGPAFTTEGLDPARWMTRGGLGLTTTYASGMEVLVRYDVDVRKSFTNQTASVKLRMPF